MQGFGTEELQALSEVFAFLGNSLLKPVNQTPKVGLDPAFWDVFPAFGDADVHDAVTACRAFAASDNGSEFEARVATEYAHLFVGPLRPAAAPWEAAYRGGGNVGFGAATFEMREELRRAGLEMAGESNQYADHMGIELLLLSELVGRAARGEGELKDAAAFAARHPATWIVAFRATVDTVAPSGYHANLLTLAQAYLDMLS